MDAVSSGTRWQDVFPAQVADLFARDWHRPGSVDAVLIERMVPVTRLTARDLYAPPTGQPYRGGRPALEAHVRRVAGDAVHPVQAIVALLRFCHRLPQEFPSPDRPAIAHPDEVRAGGTEEEIIAEGNPLAAERARLLCALAQVAGMHARVVHLARTDPAERHTVTEVWTGTRWSVFDPFSGRFFTWPKHGYASAWDMHELPRIADEKADHGRQRYVDSAYYRWIAIADYRADEANRYSYDRDPLPPVLVERLRAGLGS
jgi:hypothetical protein